MIAKWGGVCAACGENFTRGENIKPRWLRDKATGNWARVAGKWSHEKCPVRKVRVDEETGEIIEWWQGTFDGTEVDFEEADRSTEPKPPESFRVRTHRRRILKGQERLDL